MAESFGVNYDVEPIDTEIIAISHGIKTAFRNAPICFATNIAVFTESQTTAKTVNGKNSLTSRKEVLEIKKSQEE